MSQRCLLIADDLTGGADAGAQFAKIGLSTILISLKDDAKIDFSNYHDRDVLVVNTDSRGLRPEKAFSSVSRLLKGYNEELFPIIYKKIDSTLRGNIGYEIDAIVRETRSSNCFVAPSYPEQNRTVVAGILMVGGKPLALTEVAHDAASPVQESHVCKLLEKQSLDEIGRIDLQYVASGLERLQKAVNEEQEKGNKIIIFDAVTRRDLKNIVDLAFSMDSIPLLVGSAGLAEEVAKKLSPWKTKKISHPLGEGAKPIRHIFIISGSASSMTHEQLNLIERWEGMATFELDKSFLLSDKASRKAQADHFSLVIGKSLSKGHSVLKTCQERLLPKNPSQPPIHIEISKNLGLIGLSALKNSGVDIHGLALIIVGGDTAMSVFNYLKVKGLEIVGEIMEGIVMSHLIGGPWEGLKVITKAGAFGKKDAIVRILEILESGMTSPGEKLN
jgi:uncharacterized protein YgbK (DUF1537 family)